MPDIWGGERLVSYKPTPKFLPSTRPWMLGTDRLTFFILAHTQWFCRVHKTPAKGRLERKLLISIFFLCENWILLDVCKMQVDYFMHAGCSGTLPPDEVSWFLEDFMDQDQSCKRHPHLKIPGGPSSRRRWWTLITFLQRLTDWLTDFWERQREEKRGCRYNGGPENSSACTCYWPPESLL